jgi:hypothetical protein
VVIDLVVLIDTITMVKIMKIARRSTQVEPTAVTTSSLRTKLEFPARGAEVPVRPKRETKAKGKMQKERDVEGQLQYGRLNVDPNPLCGSFSDTIRVEKTNERVIGPRKSIVLLLSLSDIGELLNTTFWNLILRYTQILQM